MMSIAARWHGAFQYSTAEQRSTTAVLRDLTSSSANSPSSLSFSDKSWLCISSSSITNRSLVSKMPYSCTMGSSMGLLSFSPSSGQEEAGEPPLTPIPAPAAALDPPAAQDSAGEVMADALALAAAMMVLSKCVCDRMQETETETYAEQKGRE
jgi:hypothetical protein